MKREIKFRGKTLSGGFVYGDLLHYTNPYEGDKVNNGCIIVTEYKSDKDNSFKIVDPETVGQFTGLLDKNGKEIFEGDIIEIKEIGGYGCKRKGVVEYNVDDCAFVVRVLPPSWAGIARLSTKAQICADGNCTHEYINQYTVIGNIHDNPELLKTEAQ